MFSRKLCYNLKLLIYITNKIKVETTKLTGLKVNSTEQNNIKLNLHNFNVLLLKTIFIFVL